MARGAPQQQNPNDSGLGPLWIVIAVFAAGYAVWYFAHDAITAVVLKIKFFEAIFIGLFTTKLQSLTQTLPTLSPDSVTFSDFALITNTVGTYLAYPVAVILVALALVLYMGNPLARFKKTYSMKRLFDEERENWPQITPVANVDLVKIHVDKGPWSMAKTPMQFAKAHKLLQEIRSPGGMSSGGRPDITVSLLRPEAYQVFALQLGPFWPGLNNLNIHTKALCAVFAARANRDTDSAFKLLQHIAGSGITGQLDFTGTQELFDKHKGSKIMSRVIERHAYILTVMASLLVAAREDGVLASADFLWLKLVDRRLWFMMNAVGRQTPPAEVAGAFAHWNAERLLGRRISTPMVEEAVNALELALKEVIYIPDEEAA